MLFDTIVVVAKALKIYRTIYTFQNIKMGVFLCPKTSHAFWTLLSYNRTNYRSTDSVTMHIVA